jgi:apolipoprotein N-acyltransferase
VVSVVQSAGVALRGRAGGVGPDTSTPRALPRPVALVAALAAGAALVAAFPPYDVWWLAPVAVALLGAAVHRRRVRGGAVLGLLTGLAFFVPLLSWTNLHTGDLPWLLLSTAQAVFVAGVGAAAAWCSVLVDRYRALWAPLTALLWVAQEAARDRLPFGGFPWGRLAFSQADGPLLPWAAVGGAPLVTFAVALTGGLLLAAGWRGWPGRRARRWVPAVALLGAVALPGVVAAVLPRHGAPGPQVRVAIVQGNVPRLGFEFNAQRRAVLDNHVNATLELAARVAAGQERPPDLVVWPENASDIDPLRNPDAAARISQAADAVRAPILVGALKVGPAPGELRNVGLLWQPVTGPDLGQLYVKRHPVPFAEYVPLRAVARQVSTQVDLIRDMSAGTRPGVISTGPVVLGDVICFEVAYDALVRDTVTGGARLLSVQTNNATFNAAEAHQQLAMVRLRAVEHARSALMASTVGVSGFVDADGRVDGATSFNAAAVVVRDVSSSAPRTLATRLGGWPEVILTGLAAGVLAAGVFARRRRVTPPPGDVQLLDNSP